MGSLLASYNYSEKSIENEMEFKNSIIECILNQKYKLCLILCESKGVPIVLHIDQIKKCQLLLNEYGIDSNIRMYISVSCINCLQYKTREITLSNDDNVLIFDDYVLFILPFEQIDSLRERQYNSLNIYLSYKVNECVQDATYINKVSINLNEYQKIYKKQGWIQSKQTNFKNKDNIFHVEEKENDEILFNDEGRYKVKITEKNREQNELEEIYNEIHLAYTLFLGALNVYEKFGLKYIDADDLDVLEAQMFDNGLL